MSERDMPVFPGWETVRLIGRGSFGAVYEIRRDLFGSVEEAAMKVIHIPQSDGDVEELQAIGYDDASITAHFQEHLQALIKEYSLMAELKGHTNVMRCEDIQYVQCQDGFSWDVFIRMELLTPLLKALNQAAEPLQIAKLGLDMCSVLEECERCGIIHRDIKPQNIFISKFGEFKLGDFGIAKTIASTTGGTVAGTLNYMAPEVYGNRPYGHRADLYSLGLVMYWLLNDKRGPFLPLPPAVPKKSESDQALTRRMKGELLPGPAHGSEELKAAVLKSCAYAPEDRFASAREMRDALLACPEFAMEATIGGARKQASATDAGTKASATKAAAQDAEPAQATEKKNSAAAAKGNQKAETPAQADSPVFSGEDAMDRTQSAFDAQNTSTASKAAQEPEFNPMDETVGVFGNSASKEAPKSTSKSEGKAAPKGGSKNTSAAGKQPAADPAGKNEKILEAVDIRCPECSAIIRLNNVPVGQRIILSCPKCKKKLYHTVRDAKASKTPGKSATGTDGTDAASQSAAKDDPGNFGDLFNTDGKSKTSTAASNAASAGGNQNTSTETELGSAATDTKPKSSGTGLTGSVLTAFYSEPNSAKRGQQIESLKKKRVKALLLAWGGLLLFMGLGTALSSMFGVSVFFYGIVLFPAIWLPQAGYYKAVVNALQQSANRTACERQLRSRLTQKRNIGIIVWSILTAGFLIMAAALSYYVPALVGLLCAVGIAENCVYYKQRLAEIG